MGAKILETYGRGMMPQLDNFVQILSNEMPYDCKNIWSRVVRLDLDNGAVIIEYEGIRYRVRVDDIVSIRRIGDYNEYN